MYGKEEEEKGYEEEKLKEREGGDGRGLGAFKLREEEGNRKRKWKGGGLVMKGAKGKRQGTEGATGKGR